MRFCTMHLESRKVYQQISEPENLSCIDLAFLIIPAGLCISCGYIFYNYYVKSFVLQQFVGACITQIGLNSPSLPPPPHPISLRDRWRGTERDHRHPFRVASMSHPRKIAVLSQFPLSPFLVLTRSFPRSLFVSVTSSRHVMISHIHLIASTVNNTRV